MHKLGVVQKNLPLFLNFFLPFLICWVLGEEGWKGGGCCGGCFACLISSPCRVSGQWQIVIPTYLPTFQIKSLNFLLWHAGMDNCSDKAGRRAGEGGRGVKKYRISFWLCWVPAAPKPLHSTPLHSPIIFLIKNFF